MKGVSFYINLSKTNLEFDARLKFGESLKRGNTEFSTSCAAKRPYCCRRSEMAVHMCTFSTSEEPNRSSNKEIKEYLQQFELEE